MPNRSIPIPVYDEAAAGGQSARHAVIEFVSRALKVHAAPAAFFRGSANLTVFVPPIVDAKVQAAADAGGLTYQDAFAGLASVGASLAMAARAESVVAAAGAVLPFTAQAGQDTFYRTIRAALTSHRVCMAEASTGVGKSRAMIAAALDVARTGGLDGPIVVAAPTLAILGGSLWQEYESLVTGDMANYADVLAGFLPGLGEFVDPDAIADYLNGCTAMDEAPDAGVADWFAAGGPVVQDTALMRALASKGIKLRWLASDLRAVARDVDPASFVCKKLPAPGSDHFKLGEMVEALRAAAANSRIIFCTHAMLIIAKRSAWQVMPKPAVIILDEAHGFEQIATGVLSESLSLYTLRRRLQVEQRERKAGKRSALAKALVAVKLLSETLRNQILSTRQMVPFTPEIDGYEAVYRQMADVGAILSTRSLKGFDGVQAALTTIKAALSSVSTVGEATGRYCYVQFSPDRRYPSLLVGSATVGPFLRALWHDAEGGVILASATLFTPDRFGAMRCDYMRRLLCVDNTTVDAPPPVLWPEITRLPTLHEPTPKLARPLSRPRAESRTPETEAKWLKAVAKQCATIANGAVAGTLVLGASYAQVTALAKHLTESFGDRVIAQSGDMKFAVFQNRFISAASAGKRPILVATGAAWVGINLTRAVPVRGKRDDLLSDLVIACLPVGLNRTISMLRRVERSGTQPIAQEATMLLRQGIGRLVREAGAKHKHIWMLDGRLWTPWPGMQTLQALVRHTLSAYNKRQAIEA